MGAKVARPHSGAGGTQTMYAGDGYYDDDITSPLKCPLPRQPRHQYPLYGLFGEFLGITASLKTAKAHKAKAEPYYYRREMFDDLDPDWQRAKERGLIC